MPWRHAHNQCGCSMFYATASNIRVRLTPTALPHHWFGRLGLIGFKRFNVFGRLDKQFPNTIAFSLALVSLAANKLW